jgi:hypothetical protein
MSVVESIQTWGVFRESDRQSESTARSVKAFKRRQRDRLLSAVEMHREAFKKLQPEDTGTRSAEAAIIAGLRERVHPRWLLAQDCGADPNLVCADHALVCNPCATAGCSKIADGT